jgi:hypothetical protein
MARTVAELPPGTRITDYLSLGVVAKTFPASTVEAILERTGNASIRQRDLPAHVVIYYVIALALYLQSSYGEVLREILEERVVSSRSRSNPRGVKRKICGYPLRPRGYRNTMKIVIENHTRIII